MDEGAHPVAERIRRVLQEALAPRSLDIVDESYKHAKHAHVVARSGTAGPPGETHFKIKVVADAFEGKSRIDRHRQINGLLADEMGPGGVHAMAIEARAPSE